MIWMLLTSCWMLMTQVMLVLTIQSVGINLIISDCQLFMNTAGRISISDAAMRYDRGIQDSILWTNSILHIYMWMSGRWDTHPLSTRSLHQTFDSVPAFGVASVRIVQRMQIHWGATQFSSHKLVPSSSLLQLKNTQGIREERQDTTEEKADYIAAYNRYKIWMYMNADITPMINTTIPWPHTI